MPKKVFAVTNVKLGSGEGEYFAAGSEVDVSKLDKKTLVSLHDAGAIEVRTVDDEDKEAKPVDGENPEALKPDGTPVMPVSSTPTEEADD